MEETLFVRPAEGLRVLDPETLQPLPAEGRIVPPTSYWRRAINRGDVQIARRPAPAARGRK